MFKFNLINYALKSYLIQDVLNLIHYQIYQLEYKHIEILNYIKEKFVILSIDDKHYMKGYYYKSTDYRENEAFTSIKYRQYWEKDYITIHVKNNIEIKASFRANMDNFK